MIISLGIRNSALYLCLFLSVALSAQSDFYKKHSLLFDGEPASVVQLPDSGYVIYSSDNSGNSDQEVRRLDKYGNVIWCNKLVINGTTERASTITLNSKNQILIAGSYNNANSINLFKLDLNGNILFRKVYSGAGAPRKISEDANGNLYIINQYAELIKTDSVGNLKWKKSYVYINNFMNVFPVSPNKIILIASDWYSVGFFSGYDILQLQIDSIGTVVSQKGYGSNASEYVYDAVMGPNKNIYTVFDYDNPAQKDSAIGIMCTDTLGNQLWTKIVSANVNAPINASVMKDGSIICSAAQTSGVNSMFHLFRFLSDGKAVKHIYLPLSSSFLANGYPRVGATSDNGCFLIGRDNLVGQYGFLKIGSSLESKCKTWIPMPILERKIVLDELQYMEPVQNLSSSVTNSTYSFTPFTSTIVSSCTPVTCSTSASFLPSSGNVCQGSTITFSNNSSNYSTSSWRVNGVNVGTTANLIHLFSAPGSYTISLNVTGACTDSAKQVVFIDSLPDPNFSWTKKELKVRFLPTKYKNGMCLSWNFGDGTPINANVDSVWHNYKEVGLYNVCLTESNACGSKQICKPVNLSSSYSNSFYKRYKNTIYSPTYHLTSCLIQMADGTYFLTGTDVSSSSTAGALVHKLDSSGDILKSKLFSFGPTSSNKFFETITPTYEGGFLVSGYSIYSGSTQIFGKVDSTFNYAYLRTFSTGSFDRPGNNLELADGRMMFSGGNIQGYLLVLRKNCSLLFYRTYNAFKNITTIRRSRSGSYYVFGNDAANMDFILMKLDSTFSPIWTKKIDYGTSQCIATDMQVSKSEKVFMSGYHTGGTGKMILTVVDSSGNVLTSTSYAAGGSNYGKSIVFDQKEHLYMSSYIGSSTGTTTILKTDTLGNIITSWSPSTNSIKIRSTHDNGIALAANTDGSMPTGSMVMLKTDSTGYLACAGTPVIMTQAPLTITISPILNFVSSTTPSFSTVPIAATYNGETDTTLCFTSTVTAVSDHMNGKDDNIYLYPNPANDDVKVVSGDNFISYLELVNDLGQVVFIRKSEEMEITIDMREYKSGIYFVKVRDKGGMIFCKKLVKL